MGHEGQCLSVLAHKRSLGGVCLGSPGWRSISVADIQQPTKKGLTNTDEASKENVKAHKNKYTGTEHINRGYDKIG